MSRGIQLKKTERNSSSLVNHPTHSEKNTQNTVPITQTQFTDILTVEYRLASSLFSSSTPCRTHPEGFIYSELFHVADLLTHSFHWICFRRIVSLIYFLMILPSGTVVSSFCSDCVLKTNTLLKWCGLAFTLTVCVLVLWSFLRGFWSVQSFTVLLPHQSQEPQQVSFFLKKIYKYIYMLS